MTASQNDVRNACQHAIAHQCKLMQVMYRVVGPDLRGKLTIEFTVFQAHGLQDMDVGAELVKTKQTGIAPGRNEFENPI